MITRRRGRTMNTTEVQSVEVDVVDAVGTDEDLPSPSEGFSADSIYTAGMELEDLFGQDYLKWTEGDTAAQLFDIELADLGVCSAKDQDSEFDASVASSPERVPSDLKMKNRPNQSSHRINKNAIAARMNRLKKKEYVSSLENKVGILSTEKDELKQENLQLTKRVEELEDETRGQMQMTTTTPYPGNVSKWRRKRHLVACVSTWTRTVSRWSSALSVLRVQAHRSKCRVKYLSLFSDIETELDKAQCTEPEGGKTLK